MKKILYPKEYILRNYKGFSFKKNSQYIMKNRLGLQEEKRIEDQIIKNIKNLFNLKKRK